MLEVLGTLREINTLSVLLRMLLAVLCGGLIGIEREYKRRPAGFRTHILICLGAALTTMTSQYLALEMHYATDVARLGAQVVAGVGFIGAGTIIVTRRRRVKGLTTAAGLWTAAIVGLSAGAGFYEAAVFATALVLLAELVFARLEYRILRRERDVCLYVECRESDALDEVIGLLDDFHIDLVDLEMGRTTGAETPHFSAILTLHARRRTGVEQMLAAAAAVGGVAAVEEL